MTVYLRKLNKGHFTHTQGQHFVVLSAVGISAAPSWWVTALSLQTPLRCGCCQHHLAALSWGCRSYCGHREENTIVSCSSHSHIIFACYQRHVCMCACGCFLFHNCLGAMWNTFCIPWKSTVSMARSLCSCPAAAETARTSVCRYNSLKANTSPCLCNLFPFLPALSDLWAPSFPWWYPEL